MTGPQLQHASVPRPSGQAAENTAIEFYSGLLGLEHIPKPRTFTDIEVTWFRAGGGEVHVFAAPGDSLAGSGTHFCLNVNDLAALRGRIEQSGHAIEEAAPIPNRPRFYVRDPWGNRIEITQIEGNYLG